MSITTSWPSRPTSATPRSPTPTGTAPLSPSCSPVPPSVSNVSPAERRSACHGVGRAGVPRTPARLLSPAPPRTTGRQRPYDRQLPRHLHVVSRLCRRAHRTDPLGTDPRGTRRAPGLGFLDHLETERGNSARTRNLRLTAILSFMRYASLREPTLLPIAQRVLAIPVKRFDRPVLGYLSREEVTAIIDAPDRSTWSGQRDAVLFAVLYNTGARVSEITRLHVADVLLDRASSLLPPRQGTQGACRPALEKHRSATTNVAFPNRSQPRRPRVSQSRRQALVALRRRVPTARRLPKGFGPSPLARNATDLAPHAAPHDRDASAPVRSRHHRHCPLARS